MSLFASPLSTSPISQGPRSVSGAVAGGSPIERIAKPWGEELILSRTEFEVVKLLRINPNCRLSLQFHRHKAESLTLWSGSVVLSMGTSVPQLTNKPLSFGARAEVAAGTLHRLSAGSEGALILETASRAPGDAEDIVRLEDDYGRAVS